MIVYAACQLNGRLERRQEYKNNSNAQEATKYRERPHKRTSPNGLKALKYLLSHMDNGSEFIGYYTKNF
jgi:hypothetical protein